MCCPQKVSLYSRWLQQSLCTDVSHLESKTATLREAGGGHRKLLSEERSSSGIGGGAKRSSVRSVGGADSCTWQQLNNSSCSLRQQGCRACKAAQSSCALCQA